MTRIERIALATLALTLGPAPATPSIAWGQNAPIIEERETHYDYYSTETNPDAKRYLGLAEQYHLTNTTFWEQYRLKSWERARAELIFILRIIPNHPKVLYLLEAVATEMEDVSYPIAYYEYALRLYPQHAITRGRYGRYLARIGKREAGIAQLEQALAADSTLVAARGWLADAVADRSTSGPRQLPVLTP
jgi:predicted Zn-dependent protease